MPAYNCRAAWLVVLGLCLAPTTGCALTGGQGDPANPCQGSPLTPVAWTAQTEMGSPETRFCPFAGTCQATFNWEASGASTSVTVDPVRGESTLTATVILQPSTARSCPSALQVDGTVTLELAEGKLAEQRPITLSALTRQSSPTLSFNLKEEEFGTWTSIQKSDPASSLDMLIEMAPLTEVCVGSVSLNAQSVSNAPGTKLLAPLATWFGQPSTSCSPPHSTGGGSNGGVPQT